jgi:hypothetical protein
VHGQAFRRSAKLCPAEPLKLMRTVSGGSPASPHLRDTSADNIVHTVRLMLRIGMVISTGLASSIADTASSIRRLSRARSRP